MEYRHLLLDFTGPVGTITLNRPERLNALNARLRYEIVEALKECQDADAVRVVVIRGAGRSFCAGDDIRGGGPADPPSQRTSPGEMCIAVRNLRKPVVAAVHGHTYGAGLELAMHSDIRVAEEGAQFATPFVLRSIAFGGYILPRLVGLGRATEMLLTGEPIGTDQALEWGLIHRAAPKGGLDAAVREWTDRFSTMATMAIGGIKRNITVGFSATIEHGWETIENESARVRLTEDSVEGRTAFAEKREPVYRGR